MHILISKTQTSGILTSAKYQMGQSSKQLTLTSTFSIMVKQTYISFNGLLRIIMRLMKRAIRIIKFTKPAHYLSEYIRTDLSTLGHDNGTTMSVYCITNELQGLKHNITITKILSYYNIQMFVLH